MMPAIKKFSQGKFFRAKSGLTPAKAKEAVKLLRGIHHTRIVTENGKKSVYIMDKKEKNTY
jgi:hypothetical protein